MSDSERLLEARPPSVWFVVCDAALQDLLGRAAGEDPDLLLIEFYANTEEPDNG